MNNANQLMLVQFCFFFPIQQIQLRIDKKRCELRINVANNKAQDKEERTPQPLDCVTFSLE